MFDSIDVSQAASPSASKPPYLGVGLGLRPQHYSEILEGNWPIDWFEIISENFMVPGGRPIAMLEKIRAHYPIVMHGVSLSIASTAPLDMEYLTSLKALSHRVQPKWISDHLCWTGVHGVNLHDLLPIPYTREALEHVASRVQKVQEVLGRTIALENVSTYVRFEHSEMGECDFITELTRRTGCWLLLDINNVFVNAFNHGYNALTFLNDIPVDPVVQFHVAGHSAMGSHLIDTHDQPVRDEVWDLYRSALKRFGPVSTMIERDEDIPPLAEVVAELSYARSIAEDAFGAGRIVAETRQ